jgi:RES domain-containing protein
VTAPLSALGSKINGGRYNAAGAFEVYYLAPNAEVALRETQAVDPSSVPKRIMPLTLFTIDVELQRVVDLADDGTLGVLGVTADELTTEWRAAVFAGTTPITHAIGEAARTAEVDALIYPCARVRARPIWPSSSIGFAVAVGCASTLPKDSVPAPQSKSAGSDRREGPTGDHMKGDERGHAGPGMGTLPAASFSDHRLPELFTSVANSASLHL